MVEAIQKKTSVLAILSLVLGCFFILFIPLLGMLFVIPALILGIIVLILGIIALVKISKEENNLKGRGLAISGIVLGVVGILISIAIILPSLLWARESANKISATQKVRAIIVAIEAYAEAHNGKYPVSESVLLDGNSPYLSKSYDNQVINGYRYLLELNSGSYRVVAKPEECVNKWTKIIIAQTGGIINEEACR